MMKLKAIIAGLVLAALACAPGFAQSVGQLGPKQTWYNPTSGLSRGQPSSISAMFDSALGSTANGFPARIGGSWVEALFGSSFAFSGSTLNLQPSAASTLGGVNSFTCASHQWVNVLSTLGAFSCAQPALADLPTGSQDTALGYWTSTVLTATAIPNCTGALTYSTTTHTWGCNNSAGTGTMTSLTPGGGLVSSTTANCSQTAITTTGTLYAAECINAQVGTTYTFADGDRSKLVTASNTAAQSYTLPQAGASSQFVSGWFVDIKNVGTGVVTITPTTSTIGGASSYQVVPGQTVRIVSDGTNYQTPFAPTVGQWVLIATDGVSAGALSDTTSITSAFSEYEVVFENVLPGTNGVTLTAQFQVGGTFQTASYIASTIAGNGSATGSQSATNGVPLSQATSVLNTGPGLNGRYILSNPGATLTCKMFYGDSSFQITGPVIEMMTTGGCYNGGSGAITGIQIVPSSGTLTSGKMKIYGRVS